MAKKRKVTIIVTPPKDLLGLQERFCISTAVSKVLFKDTMITKHKKELKSFLKPVAQCKVLKKALLQSVVFSRKTSNLYPDKKLSSLENSLEYQIAMTGLGTLPDVRSTNYIGNVYVSLDALKAHKVIATKDNVKGIRSAGFIKIQEMLGKWNQHLNKLYIRVTYAGTAPGKIAGVCFAFERTKGIPKDFE